MRRKIHKGKNGVKRTLANKRKKTVSAREKVLKEARRYGVISNDRAREIVGCEQPWYHLNALVVAGLLKHKGYNQWIPTRRR